jgi:hypothetical protein
MLIEIKVKAGPVTEIAFYKVSGLHMCICSLPEFWLGYCEYSTHKEYLKRMFIRLFELSALDEVMYE